jgi:apolipoprotein N-acyltransferase
MKLSDRLWRIGAAILSGALTALATSLEPHWWAAWLAPVYRALCLGSRYLKPRILKCRIFSGELP